jgi:hypothetical protein
LLKFDDLKNINHYWQILVFLVFLLGYLTFSFYFNMNGLPFIPIDIPLLIGLGLIVLIYISVIFLLSTSNITFIDKFIYSFILISSLNLLNNFNIYYIPILLFGFYIANGMHLIVQTESNGTQSKSADKHKKDNIITILMFFLSISLVFTMQWTSSLLLFTTLYFIYELQLNYKLVNKVNYFGILMLIILYPFLISIYINSNGLLPLNLHKQNIEFKTNEKEYKSILIYQNTESLFIIDMNNTISIKKEKIISDIKYSDYYKDKTNLIDKMKLLKEYFNE